MPSIACLGCCGRPEPMFLLSSGNRVVLSSTYPMTAYNGKNEASNGATCRRECCTSRNDAGRNIARPCALFHEQKLHTATTTTTYQAVRCIATVHTPSRKHATSCDWRVWTASWDAEKETKARTFARRFHHVVHWNPILHIIPRLHGHVLEVLVRSHHSLTKATLNAASSSRRF